MSRVFTQPALWVFTLFIYLTSYVMMICVSTVSLPIMLIFGPHRCHDWCFRTGLGWCIPMAGIRTMVTTHPDFEPQRRGVFLQNHVSVFDGSLAAWVLPHAFIGLFNGWHRWVPGYGWFMLVSRSIAVPSGRGGKGRLAAINRQARETAERDVSILAFPEGHRTRNGKVGPFRRGSFVMAQQAGYPVIPVCVRGMWEVESKRGWLIRPGKVDIYIGSPIEVDGLKKGELIEVMERVRQMHIAWVERGETPDELASAAKAQ